MEWQVQIWIEEVGELYGWAHSDYDRTSKADAQRAARIARQHGYKTNVVEVPGSRPW